MRNTRLLTWAPRVLGIAVAVFMGVFALDEFGVGRSPAESFHAFLFHAAPALLLFATVALAWRRPAVGALVFLAAAVYYWWSAWPRTDWIAVVSGPLLLVGVLFAVDWRIRRASAKTR